MNLLNPLRSTLKLNNTDNGVKLFSFKIPENKAGELNVCVKRDPEGYRYKYYTELRNRFDKLLGYEHFSYFKDSDNMSGLFIKVEPEYRQKHYYFGEILRLASIIEMLENNVKNFIITSKETAVYFHSKYKFRPSITSFETRDRVLDNIAADKSIDFQDLSMKAQDIITQKANPKTTNTTLRELCKDTSTLLYKYLQRATAKKQQNNHQLKWPVEMTLTADDIKADKDFFNNLFKKHGIDYQI